MDYGKLALGVLTSLALSIFSLPASAWWGGWGLGCGFSFWPFGGFWPFFSSLFWPSFGGCGWW